MADQVRTSSTLLLVFFVTAAGIGATAMSAEAGGAFLPPVKLDLGTTAISDRQGETAMGSTLAVGLNWATIYPKRTSFDVGIGYMGTFIAQPEERHLARGGQASPPNRLVPSHGGYLEISMLAHERKYLRTWITGRGELLESDGEGVLGMATRISSEFWGGVMAGARNGGMVGVFSVGLWAELGVRELPGDGLARQISMGISGRLPFLLVGN